jgi:hypothetical protein
MNGTSGGHQTSLAQSRWRSHRRWRQR